MAEDTAGQTPARDEMVKAGAEEILRYMGEWGTDDDNTEAKARELAQWVLDGALAGRTVVDLPEPDSRDDGLLLWSVTGEDRWTSQVEAGVDDVGALVVCDSGELGSGSARALGLALVAAADAADRLAAESGQGGDSDG